MRIDPIQLTNSAKLISDYRDEKDAIMTDFSYNPFEKMTYQERIKDLEGRQFNREGLVSVLHECNQKWGAQPKTNENIERLLDPKSTVVVGGQQAGLITGPLYTIHKIISIIVFAKEQEKKLGTPVIPLFWIAGEDHDFDEINHICMPVSNRMKKYKILQRQIEKSSVSHMVIDHQAGKQWLKRIFQQINETEHTKNLYHAIEQSLNDSETYSDFFAKVVFELFNDEGLVMLDSADPALRELESNYFTSMIRKQPEIATGVYRTLLENYKKGYPVQLDSDLNDGHLFYHLKNERILLERSDDGLWVGKQGECKFTTDELIEVAEKTPQKLSNNVVTRPLMQELLLPTLAFVAGPGEISYWSVLKPAFEALNINMPPVVPRVSITLLNRQAEKWLNRQHLNVNEAINNGLAHEKIAWLSMKNYPPIEALTDEAKKTIEKAHRPIKEKAKTIRKDLGELAEKNLFHLFRELEYLENRLLHAIEEENQNELTKFDEVDVLIRPENGLQERLWNFLPWVNDFGPSLISELVNQHYDFKKEHYIVYL